MSTEIHLLTKCPCIFAFLFPKFDIQDNELNFVFTCIHSSGHIFNCFRMMITLYYSERIKYLKKVAVKNKI